MPHKRNSKPPSSGKKMPRNTKASKNTTGSDKMTLCTAPTITTARSQVRERRPGRIPTGKRLAMSRVLTGKVRSAARRSLDPCDNSNDSGLGFDHHMDPHTMSMSDRLTWTGERAEAKRQRLDIKLESDEVNDSFGFPETIHNCKESTSLIRTAPAGTVPSLSINNNQSSSSGRAVPRCIPLLNRPSPSSPVTLTTQLSNSSRYMDITLSIVRQPEQQHRARYQTEGSRGAVKDREGNGFPIVQLSGYHKPATLQVFIGTDIGKVTPHMFYQACRVSGKNSTPCSEKKIDGTIVIELQLDPSKDMLATCDCVGILKERNVDVEHRFPDQLGSRSKKKSTRCRMIFRTTITHDDGVQETLQVCSQPIVCTQPPGIPEICKKSLTSCPATGGLELFVLGKNFLKDTRIYFQQTDEDRHVRWEQSVVPDKEFLQQTHFVCVIPPYMRPDITEPVTVRLYVVSSGKTSEAHQFVYTPINGVMPSVRVEPTQPAPFLNKVWSTVSKQEQDFGMMPPPGTSMVPLSTRRLSTNVTLSSNEMHSPPVHGLKQELIDENSQSSIMDPMELRQERFRHISESSMDVHQGDSNMSMLNENSMDMLRHNSLNMDMMNHSINDNSNMSIVNENSVEMMVRRNSLSRPVSNVCENSMDVNMNNSNLTMNEDSSCSTVMHCTNSVTTDRLVLTQPNALRTCLLSTANNPSIEELKGIDLRMKMPIGTVADLVHTNAPSLATLHSFCVTEASNLPLPAQSGQSVENYLTTLESINKSDKQLDVSNKINQILSNEQQNTLYTQKLLDRQVMPTQTLSAILTPTTQTLSHLGATQSPVNGSQPVYMSSQRPTISNIGQHDAMKLVAKSEAAAIAEQNNEQNSTVARSTISAMPTTIESSIPTPINTDRLDALVNSAVESHICSPNRNDTTTKNGQSDVMITSQDVMLNSQPTLLVPPIINSTIPSPSLPQTEVITHPHSSPNISPEVILNSQISPSLMCRNTNTLSQEGLLPTSNLTNICHQSPNVETNLMPNTQQTTIATLLSANSPTSITTTLHSPISSQMITTTLESEKAILLNATADLLQTQKQICELDKNCYQTTKSIEQKEMLNEHIMNGILTTRVVATTTSGNEMLQNQTLSQLPNTGNNFVQSQFTTNSSPTRNISPTLLPSKSISQQQDNKSDYVIPVPVKEMVATGHVTTTTDKKNEDRITQVFATMSENELINIINPSCFDQGNNFQ